MHEYSIVQALVESVGAQVAARPDAAAARVCTIRIEIGSMSGVDFGLLVTANEVARFGTICADASLEITRVDAQWACPRCERLVARGARLQCPDCDLPATLTRGDEIVLARIELEKENGDVPEGIAS
jgi:hydrogenase nickel incorporation protein HypA/HybF